jgi:hypothetical protein
VLALGTVLAASAARAGPLGNLAGNLHRTAGAAHAAAVSLVSLHPRVELTGRPQLSLDAPRPNTLNLHEAPPHLPGAEAPEAAPHRPRGLHWEDAGAPVNPHLVSLARDYHHDGLPVVKLWQADRNMLSIGLNPHGVPGIFFTQTTGR